MVTTSVIQPPSANFSEMVTTRIVAHMTNPTPKSAMCPAWSALGSMFAGRDIAPEHPEHRQREGQEHVDGVHDDQLIDAAARQEQRPQRRRPHDEDAVLRRQAVGQRRQPAGQPGIDGHVRHDPGAVDEPGLGSDDQEGPSETSVTIVKIPRRSRCRRTCSRQHGVHGLVSDGVRVQQQVAERAAPPAVMASETAM